MSGSGSAGSVQSNASDAKGAPAVGALTATAAAPPLPPADQQSVPHPVQSRLSIRSAPAVAVLTPEKPKTPASIAAALATPAVGAAGAPPAAALPAAAPPLPESVLLHESLTPATAAAPPLPPADQKSVPQPAQPQSAVPAVAFHTPVKQPKTQAAFFSPSAAALRIKCAAKLGDCGYVYGWRLPAAVTVVDPPWLAQWLAACQDRLLIAKVGIAGESQHTDAMRFVKLVDRLHQVSDTFTGGRADVPGQNMSAVVTKEKRAYEKRTATKLASGAVVNKGVCDAIVAQLKPEHASPAEIANQMGAGRRFPRFLDLSFVVLRGHEDDENRCLLHGSERLLRGLLGVPMNDYVALELAAKPQKATKTAKDKTKVSGKDELIVTTDTAFRALRSAFVHANGAPSLRQLLAAVPADSRLITGVEVRIEAPWLVDAAGKPIARTAIIAVRVFAANAAPSNVESSDAKTVK